MLIPASCQCSLVPFLIWLMFPCSLFNFGHVPLFTGTPLWVCILHLALASSILAFSRWYFSFQTGNKGVYWGKMDNRKEICLHKGHELAVLANLWVHWFLCDSLEFRGWNQTRYSEMLTVNNGLVINWICNCLKSIYWLVFLLLLSFYKISITVTVLTLKFIFLKRTAFQL